MKLPKNPFLKFGEFLVKKTRLDQPGHGNRKLCQEINLLSAGKKDAVGHYYAEKIADTLLILTVMSAVSLLVFLTSDRGSRIVEDQRITRRQRRGIGGFCRGRIGDRTDYSDGAGTKIYRSAG